MTTLALRLAPPRSRSAARAWFQVACVVGGSLLIAGLAQLSVPLPFTPVPITGQTLGVLLVGAALGPGLGVASVGLYLLEGAVGLPFFAAGASGAEVLRLASVTGGYLWGFVLAAALVGWLSRHGWDRSIRTSISAMLLGSIVIYAIGVPWLYQALPATIAGEPKSLQTALELGLYPFVVGDVIKLFVAAALVPSAWALIGRLSPDDSER
ncbi:MAG TPA: biotin transporter BioY [Actinomycetota bacterium]|nr:biotin transporter BioY [Actinomycetota bacterium]